MSNRVKTKNCHVNWKGGVNFQFVLKKNHAQRNCIKRDLPVLILYLLSIGSAVIVDEHIAFESIDILFCKMLYYCEQFLNKY